MLKKSETLEQESSRRWVFDHLGIPEAVFLDVIESAFDHVVRRVSQLHPRNYFGTALWAEVLASLRQAIAPEWEPVDSHPIGGLDLTLRVGRNQLLTVTSGTGVGGQPRNKHPKGPATQQYFRDPKQDWTDGKQLTLFDIDEPDKLFHDYEFWVLLLHPTAGRCSATLLLAKSMHHGNFTQHKYATILDPNPATNAIVGPRIDDETTYEVDILLKK